jgi:hypothetical protein
MVPILYKPPVQGSGEAHLTLQPTSLPRLWVPDVEMGHYNILGDQVRDHTIPSLSPVLAKTSQS